MAQDAASITISRDISVAVSDCLLAGFFFRIQSAVNEDDKHFNTQFCETDVRRLKKLGAGASSVVKGSSKLIDCCSMDSLPVDSLHTLLELNQIRMEHSVSLVHVILLGVQRLY